MGGSTPVPRGAVLPVVIRNLLLLFVLVFASTFQLRSQPPFAPSLTALLSVLLIPVAAYLPRVRFTVYGFFIVVAPVLGSGTLAVLTASFLLGREIGKLFHQREEDEIAVSDVAGLMIVIVLVGGLLRSIALTLDRQIVDTVLSAGGIHALYRYVEINRLPWSSGIFLITNTILALWVMHVTSREEERGYARFIRGLSIGALVCAFWCGLQWANLGPAAWLNRSPFWISVERLSATFADPNAFGIMAALLVPLLGFWAGKSRALARFAAIALFAVAPWSGSRTYWLALVICAAFWLFDPRRSPNERARKLSFQGLGAFIALVIIAGAPGINARLQLLLPAPGIQRVLDSIHWEHGGESFMSRILYSQLAVQAWKEAPIFGLGIGRFEEEQHRVAKQTLQTDLKDWRDNANNFYLQILVETGIAGLVLTLLAFILLAVAIRDSAGPDPVSYRALDRIFAMFFLVLLTGPHLVFDEVRFLIFALFGFALTQERETTRVVDTLAAFGCGFATILAVMSGVIAQADPLSPRGLYLPERVDGRVYRWTSADAEFSVCGLDKAPLELELRAVHPDLDRNRPVTVSIILRGAQERTLTTVNLVTREWQKVVVPSEEIRKLLLGRYQPRLKLKVSRVWSPHTVGMGDDARWLGVQLNKNRWICP